MTERRKNFDGRRRIERLEKRYRRGIRLVVGATAALSVAVVIGFVDQASINDSIQQSRRSAIERLCLQRNQDHHQITAFITAVAPDLAGKARHDFPVKADCKQYAKQLA